MAGSPRKADGGSKKGSKAAVTVLTGQGLPPEDVPEMPPADHYIGIHSMMTNFRGSPEEHTLKKAGITSDEQEFSDEEMKPQWYPAVVDWWNDIWQSPMANEFTEADKHGLYMACYYLHESLNPFYKSGERTAWAKQWEATVKNYGLTPSARETLRWQVAQGTAAQQRTNQIRQSMSAGSNREENAKDARDLYKRHA